jgi:hypothetical protein
LHACVQGSFEIAEYLASKGANIHVEDNVPNVSANQ